MAGGMQYELNSRLIAQVTQGADIAVDGLRHPVDYESLNKCFISSFHLLYIDSPEEERWKRLSSSGRYETRSSFDAADSHPVEQLIETLRERADFVVRNEGTLQNLYLAVDSVIRDVRKEGDI
jgi:dephospho-CoA kinase